MVGLPPPGVKAAHGVEAAPVSGWEEAARTVATVGPRW